MREFVIGLSTKIYFGTHITEAALKQESRWFQGNIMIVTTGRSLITYGYLDSLQECLKEQTKGEIIIFDKISRNPKLEEVRQAIRIGKEKQVRTVIGFGGGSAIDGAKAAAAGIPLTEDIEECLLGGKEPPEDTLPIIAIPTTAGTGSELSKGAILSSPQHHVKAGIRGKNILPKAAIVDAGYTWTLPERTTMETGFDVLAHGIESYVSVKATLFSEMLSEKAIRIVGECLPLLKNQPNDREAREKMCFASMLMGMNLADVGTCLPHRMQYPIGAATDTSHGAGLMALYPAWIAGEYDVNSDRINHVLHWLGLGQAANAQQAKEKFVNFLQKIEGIYSLKDLGITESMGDSLSSQVSGNLKNDKLAEIPHIIETIYKQSIWKGEIF